MPPTRVWTPAADGPQPGDIDPMRYRHDDGIGPGYFGDERGHTTKQAALAQWQRCRRQVWATAKQFQIPEAARVYDNLSNECVGAIRHAVQLTPDLFTSVEVAGIRKALARDRRRIESFIARDEVGAAVIADYLCTFASCLDTVERLLGELVADFAGTRSRVWRSTASAVDYDGTDHSGRGNDAA